MATPGQRKTRPTPTRLAVALQGIGIAVWTIFAIAWFTERRGGMGVVLGSLAVLLVISNAWLFVTGLRARRRESMSPRPPA